MSKCQRTRPQGFCSMPEACSMNRKGQTTPLPRPLSHILDTGSNHAFLFLHLECQDCGWLLSNSTQVYPSRVSQLNIQDHPIPQTIGWVSHSLTSLNQYLGHIFSNSLWSRSIDGNSYLNLLSIMDRNPSGLSTQSCTKKTGEVLRRLSRNTTLTSN